MVDLAIVTENIEKIRQFQNDNKAEINSAFSNQDAILEEIWTEEQAKIRQEQGLWECVAGVTTVVLGGAAIILSGGAAIPIVLGVATIAFGSSDIIEGTQDVYYGSVGDISSKSFNPLRDTLFFGNQRVYDIAESIVTFAAGSSIPIANAAKAGNVLTSTQKAKIVVSELGKEVIGTGGGFLGLKLGEGLGLSKEESMFLGMAGSIVTSKGADWVDNNWDNLVLTTKYTFSNSGKNVTLGSNGANVVNDFRENFNKVKASEVLDVDEIKNVTEGLRQPVSVNANEIRFSQSSVNGADEIISSMKANGWKGEPIDVIKMSDGKLTTIDNTRVVAAREAGIDAQAIIHDANELLPENLIDRFTTKKGVPKTWGEAIELRIAKQKVSFRNNNPFGSDSLERIGK